MVLVFEGSLQYQGVLIQILALVQFAEKKANKWAHNLRDIILRYASRTHLSSFT